MTPSVSQQLLSIKRRLQETILPELAPDAAFAREQAHYVLMALDFLRDTHEHAYRFAVVENLQVRQALVEMATLGGVPQAEADALASLLAEPGPSEADARLVLSEMTQQTDRLKAQLTQRYQRLRAADPGHAGAAGIMRRLAESQVQREMAFFAPSGFTTSRRSLQEVLGEVSLHREGARA